MKSRSNVLVPALALLSAVLGVALIVSLINWNGDMHNSGEGFMGMMSGMGNMDSDQMLSSMQEVLGPQGYQQMVEHMALHRAGGPMPTDPTIDIMMHQMMDGMMQQMPDDSGHMMPGGMH